MSEKTGKKISVPITIEHFDGNEYLSFILTIDENGETDIGETRNCSMADKDGDYLFDTDDILIRVQADNPLTEDEYEHTVEVYNEFIKPEEEKRRNQNG